MAVQEPDSAEPVGTVSLVLKEFLDGIKIDHPNMSLVYDEALSFDSAVKKFRGDRDMQGIATQTDANIFLPAFVWKREVIRYSEDSIGRRAQTQKACLLDPSGDDASVYYWVPGEIEIQFLLIFRTIKEWERMEAIYLAGRGFASNRSLTVCIPGFDGELNYQVSYEPLEDKVFNYEGAVYKSLSGRVRISGAYIFLFGSSPVIKDVQVLVQNIESAVWLDINCVVE